MYLYSHAHRSDQLSTHLRQEEPAEDKEVARPASSGSQPSVAAAVATKPKPAAAASRPSFLGSASSASSSASSSSAPKMNIDWKGDLAEQCRDAIKNGDSAAVALLLDRGQVRVLTIGAVKKE